MKALQRCHRGLDPARRARNIALIAADYRQIGAGDRIG